MKVYVVKRNDGKYKTKTSEYLKEIWFAELFNDYETALCYCPSDCKIIECELIETTELADHDKQVCKEVCDEIRNKLQFKLRYDINSKVSIIEICNKINEVLDKVEKG